MILDSVWHSTCLLLIERQLPMVMFSQKAKQGYVYQDSLLDSMIWIYWNFHCVFLKEVEVLQSLWYDFFIFIVLDWFSNNSKESRPNNSVTMGKHYRIDNKINNASLTLFYQKYCGQNKKMKTCCVRQNFQPQFFIHPCNCIFAYTNSRCTSLPLDCELGNLIYFGNGMLADVSQQKTEMCLCSITCNFMFWTPWEQISSGSPLVSEEWDIWENS